ncbi:MAG: PDZ domain-containing protein [Woeseia sp.]
MNNGKAFWLALLAVSMSGTAIAQVDDDASADERRVVGEREEVREEINIEQAMRAAEARLEEAAQRIAELSSRNLPAIVSQHFSLEMSNRPLLGVTIDGETGDGASEGVRINGITPGGAAAEAGLRAGDIITSINEESLSADSSAASNRKLLDFMAGVEVGDTLDIEYLRDGGEATLSLKPQADVRHTIDVRGPGGRPHAPMAPGAPRAPVLPGINEFVFRLGGGGWGDMEMVTLTEDLGRYFGTDKGLLVVRAPTDKNLKLKDGDVIHAIDGRTPASVSHAVRILGSYQAGEKLEIDIVRDKRTQTLDIEIPDNRQSAWPSFAPADAARAAPVVRMRRAPAVISGAE